MNKFSRTTIISGVYIFLCCTLVAQNKLLNDSTLALNDSTFALLNKEIETLKNNKEFKHVSWSVCVMSVKTGNIITEYNSDQTLIPASIMKIITTGTALSVLGKNFKFKTQIEYDGAIDTKGVLHGNIYIRGGGDPTLGSNLFDSTTTIPYIYKQWIKSIKQKGIKKIDGSVIADTDIYEDILTPSTWICGDLGNYYGAGACGLNIYENAYTVVYKPSHKLGDTAVIDRIEPYIPFLKLDNRVKIAASNTGENENTFAFPYNNYQILTGTIPLSRKEFSIQNAIPDPSFLCAWSFSKMLNDSNQIVVTDTATTLRIVRFKRQYEKTKRTLITTTFSPSLDEIIYRTNIYSINVYAESLLKMLGYVKYNNGSTQSGIYAVVNFWKSKNINLDGFQMNDGSGLSQMNNVSTRHFVEILRAYTKDTAYPAFFNSLPVAGKSGSLWTSTFKKTFAENNLRAKSGYMRGIRAYAGYVNNMSNEQLVFAIIVNNYTCSATPMRIYLEKLMIKIAETK